MIASFVFIEFNRNWKGLRYSCQICRKDLEETIFGETRRKSKKHQDLHIMAKIYLHWLEVKRYEYHGSYSTWLNNFSQFWLCFRWFHFLYWHFSFFWWKIIFFLFFFSFFFPFNVCKYGIHFLYFFLDLWLTG